VILVRKSQTGHFSTCFNVSLPAMLPSIAPMALAEMAGALTGHPAMMLSPILVATVYVPARRALLSAKVATIVSVFRKGLTES